MVSLGEIAANITITTTTNTTSNGTAELPNTASVAQIIRPEEVIILGVIIALWLVAFLAFLRKWSSLRILQPMEPRYKHNPKGLDSVRVVKRAQDSVIYKNYSRKMSVTMVARENRRLQRMHTVPIMTPLPTISMEATGTTEM
nr:hypothetical protein BaRGS_024861 [Batillaria attramentaria]